MNPPKKTDKILVAIPAYNCEKQIKRVLGDFNDELLTLVDKILVIDNRSKDKTIESALKTKKELNLDKLEIIQNDQNYGLGGSHKIAFQYAIKNKMDYVAILHGDNQAVTLELTNLINKITKDHSLSAVLGSRFLKDSRLKGYSKTRIIGNLVLNFIFSLLTFRKISDLGSGLNIFRTQELKNGSFLGFTNNFTFNIDLLLNIIKNGNKFIYYPITWSETDQVSNARNFNVALTALKTLFFWRLGIAKHPQMISNNSYTFKKIDL